VDITPASIERTLSDEKERNYTKALVMSLKLNDPQWIQKVVLFLLLR